MASPLPTPVAAAIGLLPAVLDQVRALPRKAVQLPVVAISNTLTTAAVVRREYVDLAERGEQLVARLRGGAAQAASGAAERFDEAEDRVEDVVARTPFAKAYDRAEDTVEDVVDAAKATVTRIGGSAVDNAADAAAAASRALRDADEAAGYAVDVLAGGTADVVDTATDALDTVLDTGPDIAVDTTTDALDATVAAAAVTAQPRVPDAEQPKGAPTPKATRPDDTRVDTAATTAVVAAVEEVVAESGAPVLVAHDELPLPDYDHMTLGSLRGRLRALSVDQLVQIRAYEKAHADRLPVITMLDNRIAKLASDASAEATGTVPVS